MLVIGTDLEKFAREQGVPDEIIKKSQDLSYEDVTPSLNFSQNFTMNFFFLPLSS